eukprot:scaffold50921_cov77-Phaeocystis_antarctica.AAC.5
MRVRAPEAQERSFRTRATRTYRHGGQELRQPSRQSARRTCNPYITVAAGVGFEPHTANVARRFAFETMTPRTAHDAHIALRAQQLGCETAILRVDA